MIGEGVEGPVAGCIGVVLFGFDGCLESYEVAHEVAGSGGGGFCAYGDEFFDEDGSFAEFALLLPVFVALGVYVDGVELGEGGLAVVHVVGCERCADVDPCAVVAGLEKCAVGLDGVEG